MGTKVQSENYFPGYFSMRDLNEDPSNCGWSPYYGDKTYTNGHYYNGFVPKLIAEAYPGYDKDAVKRTMLKHEAVFRDQVHELHRLYRIQRNLMDEVKTKELHKDWMPVGTSLSTSLLDSRITSEDARRWHPPSFPLTNTVPDRPSTSSIEDFHSPLSSMMGTCAQGSPLPTKNGSTSRGTETLMSRPTKVRRKMFDLQLPADEYIDTEEGEEIREENASTITNFLPNRDKRIERESEMIFFMANGGKNNSQVATLQSERSKPSVADLNEPIDVEETKNSSFVHLLSSMPSRSEVNRNKQVPNSDVQLLGFPKEATLSSHQRTNNGTPSNLHVQSNASGKAWAPHLLDQNHVKDTSGPSSHYFHSEKSQIFGQPLEVQSMVPIGRNQEFLNNNHQESIVASHIPNSYPITVSNLGKPWPQSVSSLEKPGSEFGKNAASVQMPPYLNTSSNLSRSLQSSNLNRGIFGDQWNYGNNSMSKASFGSDVPHRNGFYQGSSSGSRDQPIFPPPGNYGYFHSTDNSVPLQINSHSSVKFHKTSNDLDLKEVMHINRSSNKVHSQQVYEVIDLEKDDEDQDHALHWLKDKPPCKTERITTGLDLNKGDASSMQYETVRPSGETVHDMKSASNPKAIEDCQIENGVPSRCKKILGFPIFQPSHVSKNESSSFTSPCASIPRASEEEAEKCRTGRLLDINLPSDPTTSDITSQAAAVVECIKKDTDERYSGSRHQIDLNCCVNEDETLSAPSTPHAPDSSRKIVLEIDLEAPAAPEMEEDKILTEGCLEKSSEANSERLPPDDELMNMAAEAIVVISSNVGQNLDKDTSSQPETSAADALQMFVEVASIHGEELKSKYNSASIANANATAETSRSPSSVETDYFERMTLNLSVTKEEDYMPTPLVPEDLKFEESGANLLSTRTRKGPARRGRQRRDFQRDILPGLISLSRHEVTDDLQTFGGLMRATGHFWPSVSTRRNSTRNGCGRGRRRTVMSPPSVPPPPPQDTPLIQQLNTVEVGLEDRSLTGWGKATRRPRRQRCPPGNLGNLSSVQLT